MRQKLISIIIPVYNREKLILRTLKSVKAQSFNNWECLIVDDGSTDYTIQNIERFIGNDERFRLYSRPADSPKGASSCRNYGITLSNGDLIQFLDSDDLLHQDKILRQVEVYNGGNVLIIGKWGGFTKETDLSSRFKYKYGAYRNFQSGISLLNNFGNKNEFFPLHVYLTPRSLIKEAGYWDEELTNNDDAEFFARVILNADKIKFVSEAVAYYRYDVPENLSSLDSKEKIKSLMKSWQKIEAELKIRNLNVIYVQNAKFQLYKQLESSFPEILNMENTFFADRKNGPGQGILAWLKSKISL
ncbi:glycosyltransferase family 2 protein [Christiangramia portivictoriae]|uniref:glycosyltransferase family 2 protein n=1 Tax=Christiangramia portivictoriae TaxID=326069 RepID=UPI0003FD0FD8|nr:glycosyltransferase family 2 protein [Christiangramia portivictoriae]